jgi:hypothetical protein
MRGPTWAIWLWPGLPQLWRRGDWSALALAAGFALLLNLVLLTTFVWTEVVTQGVATSAWSVLGMVWLVSIVATWRMDGRLDRGNAPPEKDLFPAALSEYLSGNWFEVERLGRELLARNDRDVDAQLLLATMCRHTGRYDEARGRLDELERWTDARKWQLEISQERQRLAEIAAEGEPAGEAAAEIRGAA